MKLRRTQVVFLGSLLGMGGVWACSSSSGSSSTVYNTGGSTSSSSSSHGHTATTTTATVGTGTGGSPGAANLGLACTSDSDCGSPLTCILPTDTSNAVFGGGPANGYCSQACTTDTDCPSTGECLSASADGGAGYCILNCTQGPQLAHINDPLSPTKCQGRSDVFCAALNQDMTVFGCLPSCGADSNCPSGTLCDPLLQVCVTAADVTTGQALGTQCNSAATTPQCAGTCLELGGAAADGGTVDICSVPCEIGGNIGTGTACGGDAKGLCIYSEQGEGAGDEGFCTAGCTAATDCDNADGFFCFPITNLTGTAKGETNNGWCFNVTPCPNGESDCTADGGTPGSACQQTPSGPWCVPTKYPYPEDAGTGTDAGDAGEPSDAATGG